MRFEPTRAKRIGSVINRVNLSATLPNQSSFNGKLNRNKNKWNKDASLQIGFFFCSKQKKKSNQAIFRSKIDLTSMYLNCNDNFSFLVLEQD